MGQWKLTTRRGVHMSTSCHTHTHTHTHTKVDDRSWLRRTLYGMGHDICPPRDCDSTVSPRDCELLTTATAWPTVEGQSSRKHQIGSVKERFPREATSIEIWWSRLVDGKEPVCTVAGTFVMIVGALVTWALYTQGQLLLWSSLIITGVVPGYK